MRRLQAHGDLELAGQAVPELEAARLDQGWMTFDDHSFELPQAFRNGGVIRGGDGSGIEETAAVVELDLARGFEVRQRVIDLRGDGSRRDGLRKRVLPPGLLMWIRWLFDLSGP